VAVKIALVQLPLQSHDYVYSLENVPLAAGYLASHLSCAGNRAEVAICPPEVVNLGGDAAIMRWLEDVHPVIVGFSCYLWNVERTLYLCSLIRQRMPGSTVVLGGPEVTGDNEFLLGQDSFHVGVVGEGEQAFHELVCAMAGGRQDIRTVPGLVLRDRGKPFSTGPRALVGDLDSLASPYLAGTIGPAPGGGMLLETVRGCPMRCTYCYYHKSSPEVRTFSVERTAAEVAWSRDHAVDEITIIDPCFARRPDMGALLSALAVNRGPAQRVSCELNAEDLSAELVSAMVQAGLSHVEVGLQSTNPLALKNVGRRFGKGAFIRGVRMLKSAGVRVMTDVMVGLPGDSLEDVRRSIDFVVENDLCDDLSVYPLSVLPGTVLRAGASRHGIRHLSEPPYLVTSSSTMSRDDIRDAFAHVEEVSNRDLFPVELPRKGQRGVRARGAMISRIVLADPAEGTAVEADRIGQALCIEVRDPVWMEQPGLARKLQVIMAANPFSLVSWIIPEAMFRPGTTPAWIRSVCSSVSHPADREYMSPVTPIRSRQLFLEVTTLQGTRVYTMIPLDGDRSRPLWAALPAGAGSEEEEHHRQRLCRLLGYRPEVRFGDLEEPARDVLDDRLGTVILGG